MKKKTMKERAIKALNKLLKLTPDELQKELNKHKEGDLGKMVVYAKYPNDSELSVSNYLNYSDDEPDYGQN